MRLLLVCVALAALTMRNMKKNQYLNSLNSTRQFFCSLQLCAVKVQRKNSLRSYWQQSAMKC